MTTKDAIKPRKTTTRARRTDDTSNVKRLSPHRNVSAEERQQMIAHAAYLRAEERGFAGERSLEDWFAAEAEVDVRLRNQR